MRIEHTLFFWALAGERPLVDDGENSHLAWCVYGCEAEDTFGWDLET